MMPFVSDRSVVRAIWGKSDTILFIFAGASAEFALNKAVDWLYLTGKLPSDPLGRLFTTVDYARQIVFSSEEGANQAIDKIVSIHSSIEKARGFAIPDWAYRDVLFMLIHYSIASYELLERQLTQEEKEEVFQVFYRVGKRMGIAGLPVSYPEWLIARERHLSEDLAKSALTADLFRQYRKHLGAMRYFLLVEGQKLVIPDHARKLLGFGSFSFLKPIIFIYKVFRKIRLDWFLKSLLLPPAYKAEIKALDRG